MIHIVNHHVHVDRTCKLSIPICTNPGDPESRFRNKQKSYKILQSYNHVLALSELHSELHLRISFSTSPSSMMDIYQQRLSSMQSARSHATHASLWSKLSLNLNTRVQLLRNCETVKQQVLMATKYTTSCAVAKTWTCHQPLLITTEYDTTCCSRTESK